VEVLRGSGSPCTARTPSRVPSNVITTPPEDAEVRLRTAFWEFRLENSQSVSLAARLGGYPNACGGARFFRRFMPDRTTAICMTSSTHLETGLGPGDVTLGYMDHPFGANQFYGITIPGRTPRRGWRPGAGTWGRRPRELRPSAGTSDLFVLFRTIPAITPTTMRRSWQAAVRRREPVTSAITVFYGAEGSARSIVRTKSGGFTSGARPPRTASNDFRPRRRFSALVGRAARKSTATSRRVQPYRRGGNLASPKWKLRAVRQPGFPGSSIPISTIAIPATSATPTFARTDVDLKTGLVLESGAAGSRGRGRVHAARSATASTITGAIQCRLDRLNIQNLNFSASKRPCVDAGAVPEHRLQLHRPARHPGYGADRFHQVHVSVSEHSGVAAWQAGLSKGFLFRVRLGVRDRLGRRTVCLLDAYAASSRGGCARL